MAVRNAGSASIRIKPDAGDFPKELRAQLKAVHDPGFVINVSADTGQARADVRRFRDAEQRSGVKLGVDVALGQAQADMAAFRARQRADGLTVNVNADTRSARRELESLRRDYGSSNALGLNLGALGLTAVQPAVAGLAQVAAGLQQVVQAGLAVPGVIAGAASSIGTLALGLSGVKDAYDAVSKASASSGQDQAAQARAASQASNQLRNAVVDETQARKDQAQAYRDARNQLTDLNVEMRGGLISESRAILEAQKAREDLAKGNFSDIRDAQLRILEADQRVIEVRSRNTQTVEKLNDAQAKGVEGSDLVVSANERVTRAQQQVADAQAAAADAANKSSAAQTAAARAMDELSPSARKFVQTLIDMRPAFDEVRDAAQEPLFEGKAEEFRKFFTDVAPNVKQGLSGIAAAWNQNITALLTSLGSARGKGIIDRILGNTGEAQSRFSAAIDPLVRGIGTLAAAGTDSLPRLADAIGSVATRFANFIEEADKDGRLDRWINDGITGMTSLGNSVINIGKVFTGITQAAGGGGSFLQWLENLTNKWQTFVNSEEGQSKLRGFFTEGLQHLREWGDMLKELPGAFQSMSQGAQPYVSSLLSLLKTLSELIGEHPELVKTAIVAYLTFKTVTPAIQAVQGAMTTLSAIVTNVGTGFAPVRDKAKSAMDGVNDTFTKAGKSGSPLNKFSGALAALGGGVGAGALGVLATVGIPAFVLAMEAINKKNKEAEASTEAFNRKQLELESTLDRVTGKVTNATREQALAAAQNYDSSGRPGGGVDNISKGNAVRAAASLGIPEDVYGKALVGNPEAIQQVRDILLKNNLGPEFGANAKLSGLAGGLQNATGGNVTQELLLSALIGDPESVKKYTDAIAKLAPTTEHGLALGAGLPTVSLTDIAKSLAPTGQASVFAGGVLNDALGPLPGAAQNTQERNRGTQGRWRIKAGSGGPFPDNAEVSSTGTEARVSVPGNWEGQLRLQGIPFETNLDGTLTATVPLNSPYLESYAKGGPTPSGRGTGPTGGHIVEVHDDEWVLPKSARTAVGDENLWALTKGRKMDEGGPGDQFPLPRPSEEYIHSAENMDPGLSGPSAPAAVHTGSGAAPGPVAPIAPNPMAGTGGLSSIVGNVVSGIQGPIGNALSLGQAALNNGQQQAGGGGLLPSLGPMDPASVAARASQVPGLIGLWGSLNSANPDVAVANWNTKTTKWMADWGTKLVGGLTSAVWDKGVLGFFGLENSILSSSNPYNQAASSTAQFALGDDGPIGTLLGIKGAGSGNGTITDPAALAKQYGANLDDATLAQLYAGSGDSALLQSMSPGAQRAIQYAQTHAVGQKYEYGGAGQTGGYDCSGIASAIYAAATGRPPGRYFDTESDFEALGFVPGYKPGALNIGVSRNGGGRNSHMAVTLPNGVNVESGGAHDTTAYGGPAAGAKSFPLQWYLPLPEGFREGGPTPSRKGNGPTGGFFAEVHPDEFMISARGRASVPDAFLHKLNKGLIDPKELPGFAVGGDPATALVIPPPRPNFDPGQGIKPQIVPPASVPTQPRPAPAPAPVTAPPADATPVAPPTADAPAQQQPSFGVPQGVAPAPSSIDHNLPALSTGITSGFATAGNLVSSAVSAAAAAGSFGAAGAAGAGSLGSMVSGLFTQGGKIANDAANVVSSFLVGNVPGSFGDPNMPAYGRINMPAQNRPATANYGGNTFNAYGYDYAQVQNELNAHESLQRQAILATRRG